MRNKTVAALLAFFVGAFGFHKFYLGESMAGVMYLIFSWTFIPGILAFFECIGLLMMSEESFNARYNGGAMTSRGSETARDRAMAMGELKKLFDAGVITAEEYEVKRRKLFDSI